MAAAPLFAALLLSAWAWGGLARAWRPRDASAAEDALLRLSWGWALLGTALFGLGLAGLLQRPAILLALAAPAPFLLPPKREKAPEGRTPPLHAGGAGLSAEEKALGALILLSLSWLFLAGGAPPAAHDALAYHLALPKLFLRAGELGFYPSINASAWPQLLHLLYLPGVAFGQPQAAQLIHGFFGALSAAWLVLAAARCAGRWTALVAGVLWVSTALFKVLSVTALADLAVAAYAAGAAAALLRHREGGDRLWLLQSAVAAGWAASMKLTGLLWIAALAAVLLFSGGRPLRARAADAALLAVGAGLTVAPWLLWAWTRTGNPVWPFLYPVFGGIHWSAEQTARWLTYGAEVVSPPGWWAALAARTRVLFAWGGDVFAGPLPAAFLAALAWRRRRLFPEGLWPAAAAALLYAAAALVLGPPSVRYFAPAFPWLAAGAAAALSALRSRGAWGRAAALGGLAALAAWSGPLSDPHITLKVRASLGLLPDAQVPRAAVEAPCAWINAHAPAEARILLIGDIRGYHLDRAYDWADPVNQAYIRYDGVTDVPGLLVRWRAAGATHVLWREAPFFWPADGAEAVERFLRRTPSVQVGGYRIYRIPS